MTTRKLISWYNKIIEVKNNKFIVIGVVCSLVVITLLIAFYLLIYLPKQQEITLRKQVYELCIKEFNELSNSDTYVRYLGEQVVARKMTEEEMKQKIAELVILMQSKKDEIITNCVEKRLSEYKK